MGGRVWTLTQTDDTLWYHTYNSPNTIGGDGRKRRAGSLLQGSKGSGKRSKGVIEVKEEEEGEPVAVTPDRKEEELLNDYFQLKVKLGDLYRDWGAADPHFNSIAKIFTGKLVRVCNTVYLLCLLCVCEHVRFILYSVCVLSLPQVCVCCVRTPQSACSPSSAPLTTTYLVSRAWWRGCASPWAPLCVSWTRPATTTSPPCMHSQVPPPLPPTLLCLIV